MNDNSKTMAALVLGLACGAVLGLLFAPKAGVDTLADLEDSIDKFSDSVKETAQSELDKLISLKDRLITSYQETMQKEQSNFIDEPENA